MKNCYERIKNDFNYNIRDINVSSSSLMVRQNIQLIIYPLQIATQLQSEVYPKCNMKSPSSKMHAYHYCFNDDGDESEICFVF